MSDCERRAQPTLMEFLQNKYLFSPNTGSSSSRLWCSVGNTSTSLGSESRAPVPSLSLFAWGPGKSHILPPSFLPPLFEITTSILPECRERASCLTDSRGSHFCLGELWLSERFWKHANSVPNYTCLSTLAGQLISYSWPSSCTVGYSLENYRPHKSLFSVYQVHINHSKSP